MFFTRVLLLLLVLISWSYGHKRVKKDQKNHEHNIGIIGGHKISIEQVPYIVSIRLDNGTFHWCGGSIIHERFILTAAHCVVPNEEFKVRVGADKLNVGGKLYDVEKIIKHEQFNKTLDLDYDVCIFKLNEPLTFGPTVKKVLLTENIVNLEEGTLLNTTGWGKTNSNAYAMSNNLLQTSVPVVSREECIPFYALSLNITDRMMCAGEPGKDTCQGDSGGPLTWNNVQVGITSFGAGCGEAPGIYTKISAVKPWIEDTIKKTLTKKKEIRKLNDI